jgi:hypothetical protein
MEAALRAGQAMREAQREFFETPFQDRDKRRAILNRARPLEREFDRLAAAALSPQEGFDL